MSDETPLDRADRKLAAIFAADVEGYSRLMERDELGTLRSLTSCRAVMDRLIAQYRGRIANTAGDSVLAEFGSVVDAVECAAEVQQTLAAAIDAPSSEPVLRFRIGIHVGDVILRNGDLFGDGVNIAARLQALAPAGGVFVSGSVKDHVGRRIGSLVFHDRGVQAVKNISDPVRVYQVSPGEAAEREAGVVSSAKAAGLAAPDRPSIAVLPFDNIGGDPQQEYFADGMVDEITTALSRVRWFFVIARGSSFSYKGRAVVLQDVARELGVRYVLQGSVRKSADRVRISGNLVDAATGRNLWADRYDGSIDDVFELQDKVTASVVGAVEPNLRRAEIERASAKPTENLDAYDCYLRALQQNYVLTKAGNDEALRLLAKATEIDPTYTLAQAFASFCHIMRHVQAWQDHPERERDAGLALARMALQDHRDDPTTLCRAAHGLAYHGQDYDMAVRAIDRSLLLNPNSAQALNSSGWIGNYIGDASRSVEHFHQAMRLSPLDPEMSYMLSGLAIAYCMAQRWDDAILWGRRAVDEQPDWTSNYRPLAAAYAQLGRLAEAQNAAAKLMALEPDYSISRKSRSTYRDTPSTRLYLEGLLKAGLPP